MTEAYFPISLEITNRPCTVIGGGRVAERKIKGLLSCGGKGDGNQPKGH